MLRSFLRSLFKGKRKDLQTGIDYRNRLLVCMCKLRLAPETVQLKTGVKLCLRLMGSFSGVKGYGGYGVRGVGTGSSFGVIGKPK